MSYLLLYIVFICLLHIKLYSIIEKQFVARDGNVENF